MAWTIQALSSAISMTFPKPPTPTSWPFSTALLEPQMTSEAKPVALKECPFCDGKAWVTGYGPYRVQCGRCKCSIGPLYVSTEAEAIAAWNRRQPVEADAKPVAWRSRHFEWEPNRWTRWQDLPAPVVASDWEVQYAYAHPAEPTEKMMEVKALEWQEITSPREVGDIEADTAVGVYSIAIDDAAIEESGPDWKWDAWTPHENLGHFGDLEAAKAAAQADFDARIRSALAPSPAITDAEVAAFTPVRLAQLRAAVKSAADAEDYIGIMGPSTAVPIIDALLSAITMPHFSDDTISFIFALLGADTPDEARNILMRNTRDRAAAYTDMQAYLTAAAKARKG